MGQERTGDIRFDHMSTPDLLVMLRELVRADLPEDRDYIKDLRRFIVFRKEPAEGPGGEG